MGFMASGGEIQVSKNTTPWMDRKRSYLPSLTDINNTNWETASMYTSVAEEATRKAKSRFKNPVECWGCTNSPRYHADMFHTYRNCPNNNDPEVSEWKNKSIQEYYQRTSMMGGSIGDQDSQG